MLDRGVYAPFNHAGVCAVAAGPVTGVCVPAAREEGELSNGGAGDMILLAPEGSL